jgi:predicted DNA-binding transcriptional regulator AlpA
MNNISRSGLDNNAAAHVAAHAVDSDQGLIPGPALQRMFGVSDMTIHRWRNNPRLAFPKPIKIGTKNYWRRAEIQDWIAARAVASAAA